MVAISRSPVLRLLTALVVALMPACFSWHTAAVGPRQYISEQQPSVVRLTLTDGRLVELEDPLIIDQSIVGVPAPGGMGRPMVPPDPVAVPLSAVAIVEARRISRAMTGAVLVVSVAAVILTLRALRSDVAEAKK